MSGTTVTIKALSLWEPWATLMALGLKRIETRSWYTSHRGPLLICASKRRNVPELFHLLRTEKAFREALLGTEPHTLGDADALLNYGKAVCVVDLVDCCPTAAFEDVEEPERSFGDYSRGRYAWVTEDLRRIKPFPVTGHQGLWNQPVDEERLRTTWEARS